MEYKIILEIGWCDVMDFLKKNMGKVDRIIRIIVGVGLLAGGMLYVAAPISYILALIGIVFLVTSLTGRCPAYTVLKISTMERHSGEMKGS